jgi:uncharacterized membrane protein
MTQAAVPVRRRRRFARYLLKGFAVLLPVFLTGYIVMLVFRFVDSTLGYLLARLLERIAGICEPCASGRIAGSALAVFLVAVLAVVLGALMESFIGRHIIAAGQQPLMRLPLVRSIYPHIKRVTDFFLVGDKRHFHTVVAVPYPRRGSFSMGFVTGQGLRTLNAQTMVDLVHVFIPISPTPFTGYVVFFPRRDVIELPLTVDDALRFYVSGGVIVPPQELVDVALAVRKKGEPAEEPEPVWARED